MLERVNFALIKALGEDAVLLVCNGKEYEVDLQEDTRQPVFDAVEQGIFLVPFDEKNERLLMSVVTDTMNEFFPEHELEELKGAVDDLPDDHK